MKTYQSGTKEGRKNFFSRHKYAIALALSAIILAVVITLAIALSSPSTQPVNSSTEQKPPVVDTDTPPAVVMPIKGAAVGMNYADDRLVKWETLDLWKWHPAVDFIGAGRVVSVMDGTVTSVEKTTLEGNVVTVTHGNGYVSVYKSLDSDIAVKEGDKVKAGDKLGTSSSTMMSELKMGDHLHFELKKDGKYVDPSTVLPDIGTDK